MHRGTRADALTHLLLVAVRFPHKVAFADGAIMRAMLGATVIIAMSVLAPAVTLAQQAAGGKPTGEEAEELARKLSNPISDLVSVPFQFNWY